MNLPFHIFIALRYARARKQQRGISINTLISVAGVSLGVMALVIVLSVMGGFHEDLQTKILGVNSHIVVQNYSGKIESHEAVKEKIDVLPGVLASSAFVYGQVMIRSGDRTQGVVLKGIDPVNGVDTTEILKRLKEGSVDYLQERSDLPGIIFGMELARSLGVFPGDEIDVISPRGEIGPLGILPRMKRYRLVGLFDAGMYEYDSGLAFVNIVDAEKLFSLNGAVTGIEVRVDNIYRAKDVAAQVESTLGSPYYARDWMQMNKNLFSALKLEKIVMFIILTLIVVVASFNIISNLIMIVMEKSREIAILRAMGTTSRSVMSIFMIHGLIVGITGTAIGVASGYVACRLLKTYRFISLPADVYYLSYLPVRMSLFDFVIVSVAAILISFLATLYPSWQASRLDPVEPLRYE